MRIKVKNKDISLELGKRYCICFYGCSFWWEINFSRKKNVVVEELVQRTVIDNVPHMDIRRTFKISKRELKRIIQDEDFVHWVCLVEFDN